MKSHAIQLSLDLGDKQFLWTNLHNAFVELVTLEPNARHAAMLMLLRLSQESEPKPVTLVLPANAEVGDIIKSVDFGKSESFLATKIYSLTKPDTCHAKPSSDGRVYCDACRVWWTQEELAKTDGQFVCYSKTQGKIS